MTIIRNCNLRYRYDFFGGLCWEPRGKVFQVTMVEAQTLDLLSQPRLELDLLKKLPHLTQTILKTLIKTGIVVVANTLQPKPIESSDLLRMNISSQKAADQKMNKPFWVHIQPHVYCNLQCQRCYCDAGPFSKKMFKMNLSKWRFVIDKLVEYGILELYVTGGETFLIPECLDLIKYAVDSGVGTGVSTNGTILNKRILSQLDDIGIKRIQISLDTGNPGTQDTLRGKLGSWEKTVNNLKTFSASFECIVNAVVSRSNLQKLDSLVLLCQKYGIQFFKFTPVKLSGRAALMKNDALTRDDIIILKKTAENLSLKYQVEIELPGIDETCGSAFSGFAVNQYFEAHPCIFNMSKTSQSGGNVIADSIDDIWFGDTFEKFRRIKVVYPCSRCTEEQSR